ncbi:MAG: DUF4118 domain-containing protein [Flavonifractor plautii]
MQGLPSPIRTSARPTSIYQLGVLVVAMVTSGRLYSLAASILSILIFNFSLPSRCSRST